MKRFWSIVFGILLAMPMVAQEEPLCTDGTLLFREDFGGNDPSDPAVGRTAVSGMSSGYTQIYKLQTSDPGAGMGTGCYLVAKRGYRNSTIQTYSVWHIMDDHTYFGDTTRGYLLEIDGRGSGDDVFYSTVINDLCAGSRLTFSAYVANLTTAGQYNAWRNRNYVHPKLSFVLTHPETGAELARYNTDTIAHDWNNYAKPWRETADWQLIGMNFTVPEGINSVRLSIRNNASGSSTGNDFALDDIEIHLCAPPVAIEGEAEVCENGATTLTANFTNDGTFAEPLAYKWWHSTDSVTWSEMSGFNGEILTFNTIQKADSGWYKVAVSGDGTIESVNCRAMSEPFRLRVNECEPPEPPVEELCMDGILLFREDFGGNDPSDPRVGTNPVPGMSYTQATTDVLGSMGGGKYLVTKQGYCNGNGTSQWHLQDDHTYFGDLTRGYLLEIDGLGDNAAFYSTTIDGLCEGSHLTFSAYVANVMTWGMYIGRPGTYAYPRLKFVLADPATDAELAMYDTGDIPFDSAFIGDYACWQQSVEWRLVGMNFTVPAGQNSIKLTIYNNATGSNGNDFALDDIEIHLCAPPVAIEGEAEVCENGATTLTANFTNDGTFAEPLAYKWWHSTDSVTWSEMSGFNGEILTFNTIQKADSGWYKVAVSGDGTIESVNCRAMSEPFRLRVNECEPPEPPVEELCMDGILLFREDFGGNDPSDPRVGTNPVPGMSYTQVTNDVFRSMGSGKYIVTKSGYCNGDTTGWSLPGADQSTYRSQWYIQDDHTYPNDYSRGYFMEIDGSGGNQQFYQTEISGLCEGIELTFSAYVANVFTWFQYDWYTRNRGPVIAPCLKFVLTNPQTGETLVEKNTQQIPFAEDLAAKTDWQYSSPWYLVGMNFIVPTGIPAIRLTIYNNVTNGNGNDFALDDIEIRLCMTPDTILTDTTVCDTLQHIAWRGKEYALADTLRDTVFSSCGFDSIYYILHVETANCEEELCMDGLLLFREDFDGNSVNDSRVSNDPVEGMSYEQVFRTESCMSSNCCKCDDILEGRYIVTKQGYRNSYTADYSIWHIMDDHTYPNDTTRGYFLEVDGKGGNTPFYRKIINGLCAGTHMSFSTYIANIVTAEQYIAWRTEFNYVHPKIRFVITNPKNGNILAQYTTDTISHDWSLFNAEDSWKQPAKWQLVGMSFVVPEGINQVELGIYNAVNNVRIGNDFAIDDIEIRLCMTPDTIRTDTTVCDTLQHIAWRGKEYAVADTLRDTVYSHCGFDSIYYELHVATKHCEPPCPELITITADTMVCDTLMPYRWRDTLFTEPATYEILYKNQRGCDSLLRVLTLNTQICCPKMVTITVDTVVCDTLMPYRWRDTLFTEPATYTFLYKNAQGCDSLVRVLTLGTQVCCPDMITITADTTVCDTLMPFTWTIGGQTFVFEHAETQEREMPHPKWTECTGTNYVLRLDTFHCEKLWQIIVNKYNWQLLLDNVTLARFFPQSSARTYQWYKNEVPIPGANGDDYSEQNELCGRFQLRVEMDNGQTIWSNILEIGKPQVEEPVRVRIYDSHGVPVQENQVSHGVYLYRYEQGDRKWTEKRLIP